jgi:hypothetical protein
MPGEKPCENDPDKGLRCAGVFQSDFRIRKEIKMSNYRWIKLLAVLSLLVAVLAVNAVSAGLVKADEDDDQSEEVTVITVPSGDVDALYAAVYDENGRPRDNVEIVLEPGVFFLEEESLEGEARPFGGSLVLGDNTILRSTLDLPLNEDGVPTGEDPCPTGEESVCGAIIDGGNLPDIFFDGSYIVTGNGSTVSRLILQGNRSEPFEDRIGIQILPKGTSPTSAVVDRVIVRRTLVGVQIGNTTGGNNNGIIRHSWITENYIGADVVQTAPDSSGINDARIKAKVSFNLMNNNTNESFTLIGGFGGDRNEMVVSLVENEFGFAPFAAVNVQMLDNFLFPDNSSNDNKIRFSISGGHISGMTNGDEQIEGVGLLIRNLASDVGDGGWDNVIHGQVNGVEFVNTATDVEFTHVPGPGLGNRTMLLMRDNRHSDELDGTGQFSVTDNPPETEFLVIEDRQSFDRLNDNFDSTGLVGHFTEDGGKEQR